MSLSGLRDALTIEDLRLLARKRLPKAVFDFIDGGAEDETTVRANRRQFDRWGLVGRFAVDVSERSTAVEIFGRTHAAPLVISPTGMAGLARGGADLLLAKAAARVGVPFTMSTVATVSIETVAAKAPDATRWFQLYILRDRGFTVELMNRARDAGYQALVLTVDCPIAGQRERDPRNGLTVPLRPTLANALDLARRAAWLLDQARWGAPRPENLVGAAGGDSGGQALAAYMQTQLDPSVTWDDVAWVRRQWDGPLVVKGLISAEDARAAVACGADGVLISNHGGRQLNGAVPSLEALPHVVDAVDGKALVFCDSGFRRGADVVKAVALGARAVFLGRASLWGVAAGGEAGAVAALTMLTGEIDRAMGLTGRRTLAEIDRTVLWDLAAAP
jgi:isopentenyl diphosphate isomerase/L-lactate dehydrogenase-like FMN-dependent dehydrogenase